MDAAIFDAVVRDPRFLPHRGWHGDYGPEEPYLPAVQQDRAEFLALADAIERYGLGGGKALQIGLGHAGGAHALFGAIFASIRTVEIDEHLAREYRRRFPEAAGMIVVGDSRKPWTIALCAERAPYDFLFIDGGHSRAEVAADAANYAGMVRSGGLVAFHDAVQRGRDGEIGVHLFLDDLRALGHQIEVVGEIGTAWLVKDDLLSLELQPQPAGSPGAP